MVYVMNLKSEPFEKMAAGKKTIELRLFDGKRRQLDINDKIIFTNLDEPDKKIAVRIKSLHRYATFEELIKEVSVEKCGNDSSETPETVAAKMKQYYDDDKISLYGVLGIGIELDDLDFVIRELNEQKEATFERLFPDGMK